MARCGHVLPNAPQEQAPHAGQRTGTGRVEGSHPAIQVIPSLEEVSCKRASEESGTQPLTKNASHPAIQVVPSLEEVACTHSLGSHQPERALSGETHKETRARVERSRHKASIITKIFNSHDSQSLDKSRFSNNADAFDLLCNTHIHLGGVFETLREDALHKRSPLYRCYSHFCSSIPELSERHLAEPQIKSYTPSSFLYITMLRTMFSRGSALRLTAVLINLVLCSILVVVIVGVLRLLGPIRMEDEAHQTLTDAVSSLASWTSFLFGPYIGVMLNRWWTLRTDCLGSLWGNLDDLMLLLGMEICQEGQEYVRVKFHRWAQAIWLLCQFSFTQVTEEQTLKILVDSDVLTEDESRLLKGRYSQPQIVVCWMARAVQILHEGGRIRHPKKHQEHITAARSAIGFLFAHFDTPVLYSFVHLMALLVNSTTVLDSIDLALKIVDWNDPDVMPGHTDGHVVSFKMIKFFFRYFTFQGLLAVVTMLKNPFSARSFGMPMMEFFNVFAKESKEFLYAGSNVELRDHKDRFWQKLKKDGNAGTASTTLRKETFQSTSFDNHLKPSGFGSPRTTECGK